MIETVTPALLLALFFHLNDVYANDILIYSNNLGQIKETCSPWLIELVETNASLLLELRIN